MKQVLEAIQDDESRLVGQGQWVKDSCYHVHEVGGKFYSVIVYDQMNMSLMEDSLQEIKEEEIVHYV